MKTPDVQRMEKKMELDLACDLGLKAQEKDPPPTFWYAIIFWEYFVSGGCSHQSKETEALGIIVYTHCPEIP